MSSPGSGKTALLEKFVDLAMFKFGVIEGDLETSRDADRLKANLILITKTDLLPYIDYDIELEKKKARKIKPNVDILEINIKDDDSIKKVIERVELKR